MPEREQNIHADSKNDLGYDLERRKQMMDLNADLVVRRCLRKGVQPRELLKLKYNLDDEWSVKRYGTDNIRKIMNEIDNLSHYDLSDKNDYEKAEEEVAEILEGLAELEFGDEQVARQIIDERRESKLKFKEAGIFVCEFTEIDDHKSLMIHVRPQAEKITKSRIKESLQILCDVIRDDELIEKIEGNSLLLEHPVVQEMGFSIDTESDDDFAPNFHMTRREFLEKFT